MDNTVKQLKQEKLLRRARKDPDLFNEMVIKDAKTGKFIREAEIHRSWNRHIEWCWERGLKAGILAPWGSGKSTIAIVGRALHLIGQDPGVRIKIVCNADDIASGRVSTVKQYIEYSKEYQAIFPNVKPDYNVWATQKCSVIRPVASPDATLTAHSIMSTGIGGRADVLLFDDVIDARNSIIEVKRQPIITENYFNTWLSRLENDGRVIYIATRWTMTDLTSVLLKSIDYAFLVQRISNDMSCIEEQIVNG